MNLTIADGTISVTLSKRNLLALLHKLEKEGSHRTITRQCDDGFLRVVAEPDDTHYGEREHGVMTDDTEQFIAKRSADLVQPIVDKMYGV